MSNCDAREAMKGSRWCFEQDRHQGWRWRRIDGLDEEIDSGEFFETYAECALDAIRHALALRRDGRAQ